MFGSAAFGVIQPFGISNAEGCVAGILPKSDILSEESSEEYERTQEKEYKSDDDGYEQTRRNPVKNVCKVSHFFVVWLFGYLVVWLVVLSSGGFAFVEH